MEKTAQKLGFDFSGVVKPQNVASTYALCYAEFVVPLVKAVQEQQQIIQDQNKELKAQGERIAQIESLLETLLLQNKSSAENPKNAITPTPGKRQ